MHTRVLRNVQLIPLSEEGVKTGKDILISGCDITGIVDTGKEYGPDCEVTDCGGLYAMPGFIDAHIHLMPGYEGHLEAMVKRGITSARNMWGSQPYIAGAEEIDSAAVRRAIEKRDLVGPTLVNTSRILDGTKVIKPANRSVPAQAGSVLRMFREALDEGAEQIKVYDYIHPDVFEALVDMGKEYEIRIVGHKPKYVSVYSFAAKTLTLEHSHTVSLEDVEVIRKAGTIWVPALVSYAASGNSGMPQDPGMERLWQELRKEEASWEDISGRRDAVPDKEMEKIRKYRSLGGRAAVGTNSPNPGILPGESFHREMELLASCGYSCREVLEAATRGSAAALELEDRKGTLETGKDADILLLKENPLENLANAGKIERVMLMGGWIDE